MNSIQIHNIIDSKIKLDKKNKFIKGVINGVTAIALGFGIKATVDHFEIEYRSNISPDIIATSYFLISTSMTLSNKEKINYLNKLKQEIDNGKYCFNSFDEKEFENYIDKYYKKLKK